MQQKNSDAKESNIIKKQQKIIEELLDRLERLEGTVSAMEGELAVVRNIYKNWTKLTNIPEDLVPA